MKHLFILKSTKKDYEFGEHIHDIMKDYDYEMIYSHSSKETREVIQKLKVPTRIYCVGGDGTLNNMVQEVVNTSHELVVVPLGTGNDFCRLLTPVKDPLDIVKQSLNHPVCKIDTIQLNDKYYVNATCFGVDKVIGNHVHDTMHIPLVPESKSYLISIMQNVFKYQFDEVVIEADGEIVYQGRITLCTVNNGQYYGGGFRITPQAKITDGYMDICVVTKVPKAKIPYLLGYLISGNLHKRKEVHFFKAKNVKVIINGSSNMDGERYKNSDYCFKILPQSLNLVTNYQDI